MTSTQWTRKCFDHTAASNIQTALFAIEPWNNISGGASFGPQESTNVSPSREGSFC
jgi:hypothetical protein